jgi:hypothetical protein
MDTDTDRCRRAGLLTTTRARPRHRIVLLTWADASAQWPAGNFSSGTKRYGSSSSAQVFSYGLRTVYEKLARLRKKMMEELEAHKALSQGKLQVSAPNFPKFAFWSTFSIAPLFKCFALTYIHGHIIIAQLLAADQIFG